jgi:hypothetical protein
MDINSADSADAARRTIKFSSNLFTDAGGDRDLCFPSRQTGQLYTIHFDALSCLKGFFDTDPKRVHVLISFVPTLSSVWRHPLRSLDQSEGHNRTQLSSLSLRD